MLVLLELLSISCETVAFISERITIIFACFLVVWSLQQIMSGVHVPSTEWVGS
jgi:hypothetical protein